MDGEPTVYLIRVSNSVMVGTDSREIPKKVSFILPGSASPPTIRNLLNRPRIYGGRMPGW